MQTITLHNKNSEEIMGMVCPSENKHNFHEFFDSVFNSWKQFNEDNDVEECDSDGEYLEDYCEFHNSINETIKIETVVNDYIQI